MANHDRESNDDKVPFEARATRKAESFFDGLDSFLFESRHLFTLIGVFGAFSIYLRDTNLPKTGSGEIPLSNVVSFFGFGLVLLLFLIIILKIFSRMTSDKSGQVLLRPENIPFLVFLLLLLPIITILVQYLSGFTASAGVFWFTFVYIVSPISVFWAHDRLLTDYEIHGKLGEALDISRLFALVILLVATALASFVGTGLIATYYDINTINSTIFRGNPSQRWVLFALIFVIFWFYAASLGLFITVARTVKARVRNYQE